MPRPTASNAARLRALFQTAQALHQRGGLTQAEALYRQILQQDPRHADALHYLGLIALQNNDAGQGLRLIGKALLHKPAYPEALGNLGIGYASIGKHQDALACFDKALALRPDLADVHDNRGATLRDLGRAAEAVASHERAIALRPDDAGAFCNRGNALRDLHRYDDALASYDRALALQPGFYEAGCNRALVLSALRRFGDALTGFDRVIALAPTYAEARYGRGNVLLALRRYQDALASFDQAIALRPDYAEPYNSKGIALHELRQYPQALACFAKALALVPTYAAAHLNTGNTLLALGQEAEAIVALDRALALTPHDPAAHRSRGLALSALKRYREALDSYERAYALDPASDWLLGDLFSARRQICDWTDREPSAGTLADRVAAGAKAAAPFTLTGLSGNSALLRAAAETFVGSLYPDRACLPAPSSYPGHGTIRVAYVSADFHDHPMMHVMTGLFACHDRSRFELTAFSMGPETGDAWQQRVRQTFERFVDVRALSDQAVVDLAREMEIDIAVDLMGFTKGGRTDIFAHRAAPVQAAYLGYPGTMGAPYIDYIIADSIVIPAGAEPDYSEKIVRLPGSYQVNDRNRPIAGRTFTRAGQGLPDTGFVFCCFNNTFKITPDVFALWMRILARTDGSVLWLYAENAEAAANLRREAATARVDPQRLHFAEHLPMAEHLARQRLGNLFLDTLPYNGHATASLALWSGLPVLTRIGDSFAGRVAASLLHAIGLPDLVTTTAQDYEALAVALAASPDRLHALRARLEANRLTTPLFDTARFARHLEAAFEAMHARALAGLPPADLRVDG